MNKFSDYELTELDKLIETYRQNKTERYNTLNNLSDGMLRGIKTLSEIEAYCDGFAKCIIFLYEDKKQGREIKPEVLSEISVFLTKKYYDRKRHIHKMLPDELKN
jgi:hypothetical protein